MVLDIILLAVVILTAIYGLRKGFVFTLIHTCGTVGALALAFVALSPAESFLKNNTGMYYAIKETMTDRFSGKLAASTTSIESIPSIISSKVTTYSTDMVNTLAKSFANVLFSILVFLILFAVIKIILWLLLRLCPVITTTASEDSPMGSSDSSSVPSRERFLCSSSWHSLYLSRTSLRRA